MRAPVANAFGESDGKITLLEYAGYVQQRTSDWVWKASSHTRTQRPRLLYARGTTRRAIDLVHDPRPADSDGEFWEVHKRLGEIELPKVKAPAADADVAALLFFEAAAYGQEPAPSAAPENEKSADAAKTDFAAPVPLHIRNAPTKLMKDLEYGKGYKYAHDEPDAVASMDCLPDNLKGREFYTPSDYGFEKEIRKRLAWWKARRQGQG